MNIQTRKIEFIQKFFLKVQSEAIIPHLERILKKETQFDKSDNIQPMSIEELNERIDKSMEDSRNGHLTSSDQLLSEVNLWK